MPDDETVGTWTVDANEDATGVVITFDQVDDDGVESFTTALPAKQARDFADAIRLVAEELDE